MKLPLKKPRLFTDKQIQGPMMISLMLFGYLGVVTGACLAAKKYAPLRNDLELS